MKYFFIISAFFFILVAKKAVFAQTYLSRQAAIDSALKNNPAVLASQTQIEKQRTYKRSAFYLDKTELWIEAPTADRFALGVQQNFNFPSVYFNESRIQKNYVKLAEADLAISENQIARNTALLYLELQMLVKKRELLLLTDSLYRALYNTAERRFEIGDAAYLDMLLAETKMLEAKNQLLQLMQELEFTEEQLLRITGIQSDSIQIDSISSYENAISYSDTILHNPTLRYYDLSRELSRSNFRLQRSFMYPGFFAGYLNQGALNSPVLYRFRFGISLPLWFPSYISRVRSARIGIDVAELQYQSAVNNFLIQRSKTVGNLRKNELQLQFYKNSGLKQADELIRTASRLFAVGEISYFIYLQSLAQAMDIRIGYLNALKAYNQSVIDLKYLTAY